jgi:hypothetical protein
MLDDEKFEDLYGEKWKSNTIYSDNLEGISNAMVDRWKSELDVWEVSLIEMVMKKFLVSFGYELLGSNKDRQYLDRIIYEISRSKLVSDGLLRILLAQEGCQRYPSDPLVRKNWSDMDKNEFIT